MLMAAFLSCSFISEAQTALPLPGCDASPEVRKVLDEKLNPDALEKMKYPERSVLQRQVLEDLIAKYPRELQPNEMLKDDVGWTGTKEENEALRDQWVKRAKENPGDPLALLLAGEVLKGKDTPEAIRLMEAAKAKAPGFPWPAMQLAQLYRNGKYADPVKSKENTEIFYSLCPAYTAGGGQYGFGNQMAGWLLQKDLTLLPKLDAALRARLETETDPKRLEDGYEVLWGREFLTHQPQEYDAVRAQIVQDLKRLEALNPKGDAEWRSFLIGGYTQSGASDEAITAMEDALIRDFPQSSKAEWRVRNNWDKDHKKPEPDADAAAWDRYNKEKEAAVKGWIHDYPDDVYLQREGMYEAVKEDLAVSEQDGLAAMDTYLQALKDYKGANMMSYGDYDPIQFLLDHGWQPARALDMLKETSAIKGNGHSKIDWSGDISDDDLKRFKHYQDREDQHAVSLMLKADKMAGKPEEAMKLRAAIEVPPPEDKKLQLDYWWNRARFAALQNQNLDALIYYRKALDLRTEAPKPYQGRLRDELMDEPHAIWKTLGGTEEAWALWSKTPSTTTVQQAESPWEKVTKAMPSFELSDLSGKTWRLKELQGKTVLIVSWATWCGPCREELPHLEKFYEKIKNRSDIQVLTLSVDENPGAIAPFMKKAGYTFPVLPAYSIEEIRGLVPQTWVVDPHGVWQWGQRGFDEKTDAAFEKEMLEKLETAKGGQ
jgi:thiol-disulfide isomerase/thioredoxin